MKIFLDANILFSASNIDSRLYQLIRQLHQRGVDICTSRYALEEAQRNILKKYRSWIAGFERLIELVELVPEANLTVDIDLTAKDRPILASAIAAKCTMLLTGDKKDFQHFFGKEIGGVEIVYYSMLQQKLESIL